MKKLAYLVYISAFLAFITGCGSEEAPQKEIIRPVKTMIVGSIVDLAGQGYPATTKASQESEISFRVGGPIIRMNVIEGAKVKKGDLVAEIDARDYIIAEQSAKARYEQTKAEAERYKRLWKKGSVAKNDYDRKYANYLQAKAKWEEAENNLKDTKLYAPFSGYYGPKLADVGTEVKTKQPITTISDLDRIEVVTTIPEKLAVNFKNFDSYEVAFDAYPGHVFKATLKEMGKVPTPEGYTLTLYLKHKNNPNDLNQPKITAGMSCRVNIKFKSSSDELKQLAVPTAAVFEGDTDNTPSVWILEGSGEVRTVKKQHVKLGGFAGKDYLKIVSGLKPGQQIVAAGSKRLVEGQKVKILDQKAFH
ncbi:MAG: efflux RND transporter periplasmic adaptor subunit [Chlorobi bacterium]|nr:efflux RND transporter periplasmic adaptor subunit [Chlorobiota bacterium]